MNCGDFLIYQSAVKSRFTQGVNWTNRCKGQNENSKRDKRDETIVK